MDINFSATQDQDNDDGESVKLTFGNTLPIPGCLPGVTDEAVVTDHGLTSSAVSEREVRSVLDYR